MLSSYFFWMSKGRKRPAKKCFPEKLMAHFFGAVREIRTSGLIPSWLGSSTSQPEEDRTERKRHDGRIVIFCLLSSRSAGNLFVVWWAHTNLTVAWDLCSTCASRLGKRLPGIGSQGSEGADWRPIYHVLFLSLQPDVYSSYENLPEGTSTLTMGVLICFRVTRIPE